MKNARIAKIGSSATQTATYAVAHPHPKLSYGEHKQKRSLRLWRIKPKTQS